MDNPNPFFETYERKPAWLQKKLHVPSAGDTVWGLDSLALRIRDGYKKTLVVFPAGRGTGTTHFINHGLVPTLEAEGCVCTMARGSWKPWDTALRGLIDLPRVVAALAEPQEALAKEGHPQWLSESARGAIRRARWRKQCAIGRVPLEPYVPRIFSHSLRRNEPNDAHNEAEDEDDDFPLRYYPRPPGRLRGLSCLKNIGELADQNRRALCVIMRYEIAYCNTRSDAKDWLVRLTEVARHYMEARNLLLVVVLNKPVRFLGPMLRDSGMYTFRLRRGSEEWVRRVLEAHQKECGFAWFTPGALGLVAKRTGGRVGLAMGRCREMVETARETRQTPPLDEEYVKKQMLGWKEWTQS